VRMLAPAVCRKCRHFVLVRHPRDKRFPLNWYCGKCGGGPQHPEYFDTDIPDMGTVVVGFEEAV